MGEACKLCGAPRKSWQVYCGAACSAGWEMGQRPATPPEPAAPCDCPRGAGHMLLCPAPREEPAPEPDEAERVAREWATSVGYEPEHETEQDRAGIASLATLLRSYGSDRERAAERRGYDLACAVAVREAAEVSLRGGTIADVIDSIRDLRDARKP